MAKLYHTLESSRTISFMIINGYPDPSARKAFLNCINGCVEHVQVVQEIIQHTKSKYKTGHITWFNLMDAFGSLSHMLILFNTTLQHYHILEAIVSFIISFYTTLKGKIKHLTGKQNFLPFERNQFSGTIF